MSLYRKKADQADDLKSKLEDSHTTNQTLQDRI